MNNEVISELMIAKNYFSEKIEVFNKLYKEIKSKENIEKFREETAIASIIGLIGFVIYCWKFYMVYWKWYMYDSKLVTGIFNTIQGWFSEDSIIGGLIVFILGLIIFFITYLLIYFLIFIGISMGIYFIKVLITMKSYKKVVESVNSAYGELMRVYSEYEENTNNLCPVPFERIHPELIEELLQIIYAGRANTVQEAINVIIQDEHNSKMEAIGNQQLMEAKIYNKHLKKISKDINSIKWS